MNRLQIAVTDFEGEAKLGGDRVTGPKPPQPRGPETSWTRPHPALRAAPQPAGLRHPGPQPEHPLDSLARALTATALTP